jgi:lysophospholipase L1-like esterase
MKTIVFRSLMHGGLIVSSILVAFIFCESLLRVLDVSYPVFDSYDDVRGFRSRPGQRGWYRGEGEAYLSINSWGYRDRDHDLAKPANTFRIAVLGDSFVQASQVAFEDTLSYRLGRLLQTCPILDGKQIEVLNFGVGGYNTYQEYLTLKLDVEKFSPDLVLLVMFLGNDIEGNSRQLQQKIVWRLAAPTLSLRGGELVVDSFDHSLWRRMIIEAAYYSRVVQLFNEARRRIRAWSWKSNESGSTELGLGSELYKKPEKQEWREAWLIAEALLARMNDLAKGMGAHFVVSTVPQAIEVDPSRELRAKFAASIGVDDLLFPDRKVAEIGSKIGFSTYPLTRELQELAEQHGIFLHGFHNTRLGFGHMNEQGHRLVAELLAAKLCNASDLGLDDGRMAAGQH